MGNIFQSLLYVMRGSVLLTRRTCSILAPQEVNEGGKEPVRDIDGVDMAPLTGYSLWREQVGIGVPSHSPSKQRLHSL